MSSLFAVSENTMLFCCISSADSRIFTLWSAIRSRSPISLRYSAEVRLSASLIWCALSFTRYVPMMSS